jgi:hypothetical protein
MRMLGLDVFYDIVLPGKMFWLLGISAPRNLADIADLALSMYGILVASQVLHLGKLPMAFVATNLLDMIASVATVTCQRQHQRHLR